VIHGIEIFLVILFAYLLGSVPTSVWVGKIFYGVDVRERGSKNAGATNMIRILGYKAGIPVMIFDVFKGWLAVKIAAWIFSASLSSNHFINLEIGCALAAVAGHIFPVFAGFRGGKGVGTFAGIGIALFPWALLIVFGIFTLTLILTRYVSLSSILSALSFPFVVIFITGEHHLMLIILAGFVAIFIPLTHIKNILRLWRGEENKFQFRRKKS